MRLNVLYENIPDYEEGGVLSPTNDQEVESILNTLKSGKPAYLGSWDGIDMAVRTPRQAQYQRSLRELRQAVHNGEARAINVRNAPGMFVACLPENEENARFLANFYGAALNLEKGPSGVFAWNEPWIHIVIGLLLGYSPRDIDHYIRRSRGIDDPQIRNREWERAREYLGSRFDKLVRI